MTNTREIVKDNPIKGLRTLLRDTEAKFLVRGYYLSPDTVKTFFDFKPNEGEAYFSSYFVMQSPNNIYSPPTYRRTS